MSHQHPDETHNERPDENAFEDASVGRRTFLSIAAATGAALAMPGSATAAVDAEVLTDEAQFVVNHTPDHYRAALVVEFEDESAVDEFDETFEFSDDDRRGPVSDDLPRPEKTVTRYEPTPAGHGLLTTAEVETLVEMDGVKTVDFAPGSNPFWTLDDDAAYEDRVFPDVEDARDYLDYEEVRAGLHHLEAENPDRMNLIELESSPGWNNLFVDEHERYPLQLVEVTNDINDEEAFEEKDKVVYELGIHGDEPQGREAGSRVIDDIMRGEAPDFEELLDDIVIIFFYINPDGWVSRRPMTELPYEVGDNHGWPDNHLEFDDVSFLRGNGSYVDDSQLDTNRQYPTIGWTNPGFYPGEPEDAPEFFEDLVSDALTTVEHFRGYENVEFLCDYHGMGVPSHMVYNLETNAPFDHNKTHDLDEVSVQIGQGMVDRWGSIETIADDIAAAIEEHYGVDDGHESIPAGETMNGLLDWGTIYDTLNYQVTGAFLGWAGVPEEQGGLGAITVAPEMMHSNPSGNTYLNWKPYWSRHQVWSYRISMREYARLTAADTEATLDTGDTDTAFVESETLTRSATDLPHYGDGASTQSTNTVVRHSEHEIGANSNTSQVSLESVDRTKSLYVHFHDHHIAGGRLQLKNPSGELVKAVSFEQDVPGDNGNCFLDNLYVSQPVNGDWSAEVTGDIDLEVEMLMVDSDSDIPDPREAWENEDGERVGFEQRPYEVNPMQFFHDLAEFIDDDGALVSVEVDDISGGGLDGYDQLVVSHHDGLDDDGYISAIEEFVADGGDLVLTDTGLRLLGELETDDLQAISADDIHDITVNFANLNDRRFNHPLLDGIRPRQQEIWKGPQVGYTTGTDQPATVVDRDAFTTAGGASAGTFEGDADAFGTVEGTEVSAAGDVDPHAIDGVGVGTLVVGDSTIHIIGSILPPAQQEVLHPFGMADYSLSFMGHTIINNALGFVQERIVNGESRGTYGGAGFPTVETYQDEDGDVELDDLQQAIEDWRGNLTDLDTLQQVIETWRVT